MVLECHLLYDAFPHVILAWPWFWARSIFAPSVGFGNIHQGTLTTKDAGLVGMRCCQYSDLGGRWWLVCWEVGNWVFTLVIGADVSAWFEIWASRPCRGVGKSSLGVLPSFLLGLYLFCLYQHMYPIFELIRVNKVDLGDFHKFNEFYLHSISEKLDEELTIGSSIVLCLDKVLLELKEELFNWFWLFLP